MNDVQNEIDQLSRQQLTLQLLSCVLSNQLTGVPFGKILSRQKDLLIKSASETGHLEEKIKNLVAHRDAR